MAQGQKQPSKYLEGELKSYYDRLGESDIELENMRFITPYFVGKFVKYIAKKLINVTLEKPQSKRADRFVKFSKHILKAYSSSTGGNVYKATMSKVVAAIAKDYPDTAAKWLAGFADDCHVSYVDKIYDCCKNKACLNIMIARLKKEFAVNEPSGAYDEILLYKYAVLAKDKDLLKKSMVDKKRHLYVHHNSLGLLRQNDVDYGPFFEHLKHSGVQAMEVCFWEDHVDDIKILKGLLSGHDTLESLKVENFDSCPVPADVFLPNNQLKELQMKGDEPIADVRRLLNGLANLEMLAMHGKAQELYDALMAKKPEKLNCVYADFDDKQAEAIMNKYPDLAANNSSTRLWSLVLRNKDINSAKRFGVKHYLDRLVEFNALGICLQLIDEKDRPTFEDLIKKDKQGKNVFGRMRATNEDTYLDALDELYELCDFSANKKEAEMFKAIEHQHFGEYLKSLPEGERAPIESLPEPLMKDSPTLLELIQKSYGEDEATRVIAEWMDLCGLTNEQIEYLRGERGLLSALDAYAKKQTNKQSESVTKSAFEKWKEEHGRV